MRFRRNPKAVRVTWIDSDCSGLGPWATRSEIRKYGREADKLIRLTTVGLLIATSRSFYVIAGSYDPTLKRYSDIGRIPRGCVVKLERLRV